MGVRRLYLGLWLRMAVSSLLGAGAFLLLLAAAFVLVSVLSYTILLLGWLFGGALLLGVVVPGVFYVGFVWILSLSLGYSELSDLFGREAGGKGDTTPDDRRRTFKNPPTVRQVGRAFARFCAIPAGLVVVSGLALLVFDRTDLDPVAPALAGGAVIVVGFIGWLVYDERHSTGSVRARLEAEYDIVPAPEREVHRRVRRLAEQADSGVPEVEIGASPLPRAASVGYRPEEGAILVSRGLVDRLDDSELDAVLAHELAHLRNRDAAVMTALASPRSKIGEFVDLLFEQDSHADLLIIPLVLLSAPVYVVNGLVVPMVARHREYVADDAAGELVDSHAAMASALNTIDREYSTRDTQELQAGRPTAAFGVMVPPWEERQFLDRQRRFLHRHVLGTHPPTESRIERLRSRDW